MRAVSVDRFFELTLLADQSLVQAGWVQAGAVEAAARLLARGPAGRGPTPLAGISLKWSFEPGLGLATYFKEGRMLLLSLLLGGAAREPEALDLWMDGLRGAPPVKQVNGDDPEAFEIFRRLRDRPLCASVLLPEGSREECKALLDFHRGVAAALFNARWG